MSDVDSSRWMASEHDLEFVDLETYGVDRSASEILPESLARLHHVVAIKRKFGTPVIATADPDDLTAHDSVRAAIGRDFISVIASSDQIEDYLNQLFGPDDTAARSRARSPEQGDVAAKGEPIEDPVADAVDFEAAAPTKAPAPTNGKARRAPSETKKKQRRQTVDEDASPSADPDGPDPSVGPDLAAAVEPAAIEVPPGSDAGLDAALTDAAAESADPWAEPLEPATNLLPTFGANTGLADLVVPSSPPPTAQDELAELARSVQDEEPVPDVDSTALAADLVAEAVATFQEKQGEEERHDADGGNDFTETASFPPWPNAWSTGAECHSPTWRRSSMSTIGLARVLLGY